MFAVTVATDALRTFERARLQELEGVVERGRDTFIEVGNALREIRDRHLHRGTHASFEEYVRDRWSWSRSRAYQLIDAAAVAAAMSTTVDTPTPLNEAQARELAPLLRDQGEQAVVAAYRDLRERYGDQVTAPLIRRAVGGRLAHDERMC